MPEKTSLYIHIPFCRKKCFFCSFPVCIARDPIKDKYLDCLAKESSRHRPRAVETVYIGGGTPALLNNAQLQRLHERVVKRFSVDPRHEYTIETNPDTMDLAKARRLKAMGINRVSLGAQTFDPGFLKFLGRTHKAADIRRCFDLLRAAGFSNINVDVMFGFPGQTLQGLSKDLRLAAALGSEHLSFYNLSIEKNSMFHRLRLPLPKEDRMAVFYKTVIDELEAKGFFQYEISNFAKRGRESAHNILYWECQNYIGLGMGAHTHKNGRRSWNVASVYAYMKAVTTTGVAEEGHETLGPRRRLTEALCFGLRMNKGVDVAGLEKRFGNALSARQKKQIARFIDHGFLTCPQNVLAATLKGRLVLDELCGYLI